MTMRTFRSSRPRHNQGFTLVEISIVLVIIGLILGGILNAQSVIRNAQTKDSIKALNDMSAAARQFFDRYGMWPGDFSNAVASGLVCANGDGNGFISAAERNCASEHLIRAGMLKGTVAAAPPTVIRVRGSTFSVIRATLAGVAAPANWGNVVRVQAIDCDIAVQMDRAVDDGNTNTGNFRITANTCGATGADQNETIVVANAILRLN
ncbi:MAG: prepilin-type N-terminal cleavage/methylation domain-containing protein [Burkholderiales bacterium]|nr:prepilin-type N-terminal cleavage/methylation domain-containing protein [Burkholderiales bacterium]